MLRLTLFGLLPEQVVFVDIVSRNYLNWPGAAAKMESTCFIFRSLILHIHHDGRSERVTENHALGIAFGAEAV